MIRDELRHLQPLIDRLQKQGWRWTDENYGKTAADLADLPLSGETVVVTGSVPEYGRNEVNDLIERLGGKSSGVRLEEHDDPRVGRTWLVEAHEGRTARHPHRDPRLARRTRHRLAVS